ncbi:MAG TPA: hypothetical protein VHL52_11555 [Acidimicrobiia bacterium]|nr:hypothetical protein [Acidimicrobiia bacterium]
MYTYTTMRALQKHRYRSMTPTGVSIARSVAANLALRGYWLSSELLTTEFHPKGPVTR